MHCFYHVSSRMKAMIKVPRRPTVQEIQARSKSSITESKLSKRLGMSLPNLRDDQTISFQRNTLLTRIILSDPGETAAEAQTVRIYCRQSSWKRLNVSLFLSPSCLRPLLPTCSPCAPYLLSPSAENSS